MAKLKTHNCPSCSAPLEVQPQQTDITCRYCGNAIHIERAPAPRVPGPVVNHHVMYIDPNAGRSFARIMMVVGFLPLLIPVGIFVVPLVMKKVTHAVRPLPVHCAVNQEIELSGIKFEGPGPLVTAETNCKVHIVGSSLKANVIVRAVGSSVKITVESSTLEAKDAVVELSGSSNSLRVSQKSTLISAGTAIVAKTNADITIEDTTIKATEDVVRGESNVKLAAMRSELSGKNGVTLGSNPDITLKGTTLRVERTAISGDSNTKLTCDGCNVQGADGVRVGSNGKMRLTNKGQIVATGTAIEGKSSLDIEAEESRIESKDVAVAGDSSLKVRLTRQSAIKGGRVGIRSESNPNVVIRESSIEGGTNAIESRSSAQIEAVKSTIKGGELAFAFRSKPSQLSLSETTVTGGQNFNVDVGARPANTLTAGAARPGVPAAAAAAKPVAAGKPATAGNEPAGAPPFNGAAAVAGLDGAAAQASSTCRSTSGKAKRAFIDPGFAADGANSGAKVRTDKDIVAGSPEVTCIERIFRAVRIPPFDEKTRPSGLMRVVNLAQ